MTTNPEISERKRRSKEEVKRLVVEFEASGLRPAEFCRKHDLALSTLQRHLKRRRLDKGATKVQTGGSNNEESCDFFLGLRERPVYHVGAAGKRFPMVR